MEEINIITFGLDDDPLFLKGLELLLMKEKIPHRLFSTSKEFLENFNDSVHICLLDVNLQEEMTGHDVMLEVLKINPLCFVIIISGVADIKVGINLMNEGGSRFVMKGGAGFLDEIVKYVRQGIAITNGRFRRIFEIMNGVKETKKMLQDVRSGNTEDGEPHV